MFPRTNPVPLNYILGSCSIFMFGALLYLIVPEKHPDPTPFIYGFQIHWNTLMGALIVTTLATASAYICNYAFANAYRGTIVRHSTKLLIFVIFFIIFSASLVLLFCPFLSSRYYIPQCEAGTFSTIMNNATNPLTSVLPALIIASSAVIGVMLRRWAEQSPSVNHIFEKIQENTVVLISLVFLFVLTSSLF